jgi:predicted TIM-barrel fold metal-dependent hydrolase
VVPFYLDRIDGLAGTAKLELPASDYFRRNVSVTPSGIRSERYLRWAIEVLGIERIMFSTDYPYRFTSAGGARRFLEEADLSAAEKAAIAHGSWERSVGNIRR